MWIVGLALRRRYTFAVVGEDGAKRCFEVGFVGGKNTEGDQAPGDIIRAFMGKEVSDEMASAARNDAAPVFCVLFFVRGFEKEMDAAGSRQSILAGYKFWPTRNNDAIWRSRLSVP